MRIMSLFVFQFLEEGNCLLYLYCTGCANKSTRLTLPNGEKKSEPCFAPAARRRQGVNGIDIHFQMFLGVVIPKLTACWLFQVQKVPPPPLHPMCEDYESFCFPISGRRQLPVVPLLHRMCKQIDTIDIAKWRKEE